MADMLILAFLPIILEIMLVGATIGFVMSVIAKCCSILYKALFRGELVV